VPKQKAQSVIGGKKSWKEREWVDVDESCCSEEDN